MMITASYPVYAGDRLLGVSSRDITLKELARSVLSHLTDATGSSALLIDSKGLAIDATDPALAAEIDQVNSEAGAAVLYFRTADGIKRLGAKDAVASQSAEVSSAVEQPVAAGRALRRCQRSSRCGRAPPARGTHRAHRLARGTDGAADTEHLSLAGQHARRPITTLHEKPKST